MYRFLILFYIALVIISCCIVLGEEVTPTFGAIWPKPKQQTTKKCYSIIPASFKFEVIGQNCDLLEKATKRYIEIIRQYADHDLNKGLSHYNNQCKRFRRYLNSLQINLTQHCQAIPELDMDESYKIIHKDAVASIQSDSIWGVLRGLESFSQMPFVVLTGGKRQLYFKETEIYDKPRFSHRGLLIDTARHYLNMSTIYRIIDGMAYNKLNVLHWHLVDHQSFSYESKTYPELSAKGAFDPTKIYTQVNVKNIIEYARERGIRVMPEFDTPGHTTSWGASHPEILVNCGDEKQFDPTIQKTYCFMKTFFKEIVSVFPEKYIHLGGDEVNFSCWANNKGISQFFSKYKMSRISDLLQMYMERIIDQLTVLNVSSVVWEDALNYDFHLPKSTIIQMWLNDRSNLVSEFTKAGYKVITSKGWYLDHLSLDWKDFYCNDPHDFIGTAEQKKLVIGGETCMWGESVDDTNILQRIFPRASAAAERLWSHLNISSAVNCDLDNSEQRFQEHTHRMFLRGIP